MTEASKTSSRNATSEFELDESSLSAIRSILTEEVTPARSNKLRRSKPAPVEPETKAAPNRRKADVLPDLARAENYDVEPISAPKRKLGFPLRRKPAEIAQTEASLGRKKVARAVGETQSGLIDRVRAYRPTAGHIVWAAILLFVVTRPWLVFGLILFSLLVLIGVFLVVGYDGFWHGVIKASRWYAKRRPSRAAALNARLDRFAVRWDAVLDRFPEGTVDGLYLPDFAELATADARHDEAIERRLAGLQEKGA